MKTPSQPGGHRLFTISAGGIALVAVASLLYCVERYREQTEVLESTTEIATRYRKSIVDLQDMLSKANAQCNAREQEVGKLEVQNRMLEQQLTNALQKIESQQRQPE